MLPLGWFTCIITIKEPHCGSFVHSAVPEVSAAMEGSECWYWKACLHFQMEMYTLRVQQCQGKTGEQPGIAGGDKPRALHSQRDHPPPLVQEQCEKG